MLSYEQKKQQTLQILQTAITFAQERKNADIEQLLKDTMARLVEGKLIVVICGEFKQGKSSLINMLLNENGLCPVDVDITTSLVTSISFGATEKISVLLGEPGQKVTQEKSLQSRNEIADYVTERGNPHNMRQARLLVIQIPNEQLNSGLVVVDTPGVGGLNSEHSDVTYAFIPNADVVLFVSDALKPLSTTHIHFIKERIAPVCPNLLFVVTKKDKNEAYQTIVDDNRQKLATALDKSPDAITIIPVSNLAKRDYLESHYPEDLEESNFTTLEEQLWQYLNEGRVRILLLKSAASLNKALAELRLPLQTELDACREQEQPRLADMENEGNIARQRLQALLENNAQWLTRLRDGLEDIHTRAADRFHDGFKLIKQNVQKCLENKQLREHPEQIIGMLQADMSTLLTLLEQYIEEEAVTLQEDIEYATSLHLNTYQIHSRALIEYNSPTATISREKMGLWPKSIEVARGGTASGSGGAMVMGVLGGIIAGVLTAGAGIVPGVAIGAALGQLAGFATGARRTLAQINQKETAEIARFLLSFIQEQEEKQFKSLRQAIKDLERFMRDDLTAQITHEKKSIEEALRALQNTRKLTQEQMAAQVLKLTGLLQRLNQMQQVAEQVIRMAVQSEPERAQGKQNSGFGSWADV